MLFLLFFQTAARYWFAFMYTVIFALCLHVKKFFHHTCISSYCIVTKCSTSQFNRSPTCDVLDQFWRRQTQRCAGFTCDVSAWSIGLRRYIDAVKSLLKSSSASILIVKKIAFMIIVLSQQSKLVHDKRIVTYTSVPNCGLV